MRHTGSARVCLLAGLLGFAMIAESAASPSTASASPALSAAIAPTAAIRQLQADLRALGYYHGTTTGLYGAKTRAAVVAFQQSAGLTADGLAGPATLAAIAARRGRTAAQPVIGQSVTPQMASAAHAALVAGTTGPLSVTQLQTYLYMLSFYNGKIDGVAGPQTTAALQQLQLTARLTPDGQVGPTTQTAIATLLRTRG